MDTDLQQLSGLRGSLASAAIQELAEYHVRVSISNNQAMLTREQLHAQQGLSDAHKALFEVLMNEIGTPSADTIKAIIEELGETLTILVMQVSSVQSMAHLLGSHPESQIILQLRHMSRQHDRLFDFALSKQFAAQAEDATLHRLTELSMMDEELALLLDRAVHYAKLCVASVVLSVRRYAEFWKRQHTALTFGDMLQNPAVDKSGLSLSDLHKWGQSLPAEYMGGYAALVGYHALATQSPVALQEAIRLTIEVARVSSGVYINMGFIKDFLNQAARKSKLGHSLEVVALRDGIGLCGNCSELHEMDTEHLSSQLSMQILREASYALASAADMTQEAELDEWLEMICADFKQQQERLGNSIAFVL